LEDFSPLLGAIISRLLRKVVEFNNSSIYYVFHIDDDFKLTFDIVSPSKHKSTEDCENN